MTDAEKREKVIRGLASCACDAGVPDICGIMECPYREHGVACGHILARDALALLREQEARVMTVSEFIEKPLVWLEDKDKTEVIPALFMRFSGWNVEFARQRRKQGDEPAIVRAAEHGYGEYWRAWTSRPTPEQMRDAKWEVTENG